ncbi:MAG: polysaccharide deacetylase family protein [Chthoniobacterales bacterium]
MTGAFATSLSPILAGAAETERNALIVSLHDVAPANWEASRKIVAELERRGVRAISLLVVPDYHHAGKSMQNEAFVSWLRERAADGDEIIIHGYFHQRPRQPGESWSQQLVTRFYTQDEGEFHDLNYEEAFDRIASAREEFGAAGFNSPGFIAPAWLLSREAERAALDAGIEYTTRLRTVRDLRSGKDFAGRTLVYSVRSAWRRAASLAWNRVLFAATAPESLVRLSIHPPDCAHPEIWRQISELVERLRDVRRPMTYGDWVAEQRVRARERE